MFPVRSKVSCGTVALYGPLVVFFFGGPQGYGFHPIKNLRNCAKNILGTVPQTFDRVKSVALWSAKKKKKKKKDHKGLRSTASQWSIPRIPIFQFKKKKKKRKKKDEFASQ